MTGVGGRPELILEAASNPTGPWYEYEFNFKPGRIDRTPPVVSKYFLSCKVCSLRNCLSAILYSFF